MEELGVQVDLLPLALNFRPISNVPNLAAHDVTPAVIHYHSNLDRAGFLRPIGLPRVDAAAGDVNALIAAERAVRLCGNTAAVSHSASGLAGACRYQRPDLANDPPACVDKRRQAARLCDTARVFPHKRTAPPRRAISALTSPAAASTRGRPMGRRKPARSSWNDNGSRPA